MGKARKSTRRDIIMPPLRGVRRKGSKEKRRIFRFLVELTRRIVPVPVGLKQIKQTETGTILFSAFITSSHERHVIAHTVKLHCRTHKIKLMQT